jgi:glycosyltransferase A (GT-A) superfamily protein (DUF2064 family)
MARPGKLRLRMHEPPLLVIMAKAPVCGAVKTRLASEIGAVAAAALTRTLTEALLRKVARDPRFRTLLAISPDQARRAPFAAWRVTLSKKMTGAPTPHPGPLPAASACGSPNALRVPQGRGGLGQRMQRIFDACGRGPLIIVGTDIPFVTRAIIADAFRNLRRADAVIGRAEDGGYWLVGLRRRLKRLAPFENVRWSSPYALADTLRNLRSKSVAFAATLFDIDTEADYRRYLQERNAKARYAP